jgi:hypothetical protein
MTREPTVRDVARPGRNIEERGIKTLFNGALV